MKSRFWALTLVAIGFICALAVCVQALRAQPVSAFDEGNMRIVVDAGHGGIDVGVSGEQTGVKESDLNLAIAMQTKESLESLGFEVILTRKTAAGLYGTTAKGFKKRDMQKRKEIIAEADPALLLSIHQNFYPSQAVRGGQVFYAEGVEGSKELATEVQKKVNELYAEKGVKHRKIKAGEYFMLDCHPCPSVIVECGFLSSSEDERLLESSLWQRRLGEEIAAGVLAYISAQSA